jgi:Sir2- and TIR-associating SLOG family/SIR2-like domain
MASISKAEMLRQFSRELQSGDAALFIGAGLSRPSGYVNWKALMREVASELNLDVEKESDLIALAQYHVNERGGRGRINQLLIDEFTKDSRLTENHRLIASLPVQTIWTTNYDELIETAFRNGHRRPDVKTNKENLAIALPNRDVVIYKMHGDCHQPHDAVVTKEDYETYSEKRELFSTALKGDLIERTFLFLGFSFTDPNIDYILSRIRGLLGQNQRVHYCVMKWPDVPKESSGSARAEYEYQRRKLELRISDLSRYQIHAVMIDTYDEITDILQQLNKRSHAKHIFVSGSAADFQPLGKESLERICRRLGQEIISRGFNLVSGFGAGIGGSVVLGALEQIYADSLTLAHLSLFPFPRVIPEGATKEAFHSQYRRNMLSNSGFIVFISGNRADSNAKVVEASGVMEEFGIACQLEKVPIPLGVSGWAAHRIWKMVREQPNSYYGTKDVATALTTLGESGRTEEDYVKAIFDIIEELAR